MRPRHRVAIYCSDETRKSELALVLRLHGKAPFSADRNQPPIPSASGPRAALIVRRRPADGSFPFLELCLESGLPAVFVDEGREPILLPGMRPNVLEIVYRVNKACNMKRGPKPKKLEKAAS
jgi:hypothetical protein